MPSRSGGPCRARGPSRSRACWSFFDKVPDLVDLDHGRAPGRLRLGAVPTGVVPDPAHHALRRNTQAFADRAQRQAGAVELDRGSLHCRRLAARGGAGELPPATLAAPPLPAASVAGPDQRGPIASRTSRGSLGHARPRRVAFHTLELVDRPRRSVPAIAAPITGEWRAIALLGGNHPNRSLH